MIKKILNYLDESQQKHKTTPPPKADFDMRSHRRRTTGENIEKTIQDITGYKGLEAEMLITRLLWWHYNIERNHSNQRELARFGIKVEQ